MPKIIDIIPVGTSKFNEDRRIFLNKFVSSGFKVDVVNIDFGTHSIESWFDESLNTPYIIEQILKAETSGYKAAIVDCIADPAVDAARQVVRIPVIGPGESSMHIALLLATNFSIITVAGPSVTKLLEDRLKSKGLSKFCVSVRNIGLRVLDLKKEEKKTFNLLVREGKKAIKEDGAEVLILGCTGLSGLAGKLQEELGVPVIDPIIVSLKIAELLISTQLTHSSLAFPKPPKKQVSYPTTQGFFQIFKMTKKLNN